MYYMISSIESYRISSQAATFLLLLIWSFKPLLKSGRKFASCLPLFKQLLSCAITNRVNLFKLAKLQRGILKQERSRLLGRLIPQPHREAYRLNRHWHVPAIFHDLCVLESFDA